MEIRLTTRKRHSTRNNLAMVIFRRTLALCLLALALFYWVRIVGLSGVEDLRFDTMSEAWRVASAVQAVILPIAVIGLWGLFAWGTSIWLFAVAIELTMHIGMPGIFGEAREIVLFHIASLAIYVLIKLVAALRRRSRLLPIRNS